MIYQMKIESKKVTVREIYEGYTDNEEDESVKAYGGILTVRPAYQREFIYDAKKQEAVIQTILKNFPLNTMYWAKNDDGLEVLDGQQRTLSIMRFLKHKFAITIDGKQYYEDSLPDDMYEQLMNYDRFTIYLCEGTDKEKLDWFKVVNTSGVELNDQELNNSIYTGAWLSDAKRHFSKNGCPAKKISDKYIKGDPMRQELLEKALKGICEYQGLGDDVTAYMALHKSDNDADELWQYFQKVMAWVNMTFPTYYKVMFNLDWCHLYNKYGKNIYNTSELDAEVKKLMLDEEVQKKSGIYEYVLAKDNDPYAAKLLNLRTFDESDKQQKFTEQNGVCPICGKTFPFEDMRGDHIKPWRSGGKTEYSNLQMLCKDCNLHKSGTY